jgi:SAM-dependent methyltransferase
MTDREREEEREHFGLGLATDDAHYRAFVGPLDRYDLIAALQFNLLTALGMRERHSVLDIGCGSLRFGRLAIPFLRPGKYFGLEPNRWLVQEGIEKECGGDLIRIKEPRFAYDSEFSLTAFGVTFDYLMTHSIFTHAARRQIEQCLAEAARCMAAGSFFVASYIRGERDHQGDEWTYPEWVAYREETMIALATLHGLRCQPMEWEHPGGHSWLLYRLPGPEEADFPLTLPALSGSRGTGGLGNNAGSGELARADLAAARARNNTLRAELTTRRTENDALRADLEDARARNDALRSELTAGRAQNDWLRAELVRRKTQLRTLKRSVSWQITSPLRVLKKWILWLPRVTRPPS